MLQASIEAKWKLRGTVLPFRNDSMSALSSTCLKRGYAKYLPKTKSSTSAATRRCRIRNSDETATITGSDTSQIFPVLLLAKQKRYQQSRWNSTEYDSGCFNSNHRRIGDSNSSQQQQ